MKPLNRCLLSLLASCVLTAGAASQTSYELVHAFGSAGWAQAVMQASDGNFYGTTANGGTSGVGTVFRVDSLGNLTTLHSFGHTDGSYLRAGLIQASDGNLYGTAALGGASNQGTVFRMDLSGSVTVLHSFAGADGRWPQAALVVGADGSLYGTTSGGGAGDVGTVFKMAASGGSFATLHSFGGPDGAYPYASLLRAADDHLYGTTSQGGVNSLGTVFRVELSGTLTVIHSFEGLEGSNPWAALIQAANGYFYGTASQGGENGYGSVFVIDSSGTVSSAHSFGGVDGFYPFAPLVQASNGNFYGTTLVGGDNGHGTVFRMDPSANLVTLHSFLDGAGAYPDQPLIQGADGDLYGTTPSGGGLALPSTGTVFRMDLSGNLTTLHAFSHGDGKEPRTSLTPTADGSLYGTTSAGGNGFGTAFRIRPSGMFTALHSFEPGYGGIQPSALLEVGDGTFYGTTVFGGVGSLAGAVFKMDARGSLTTLHTFGYFDGANPSAALILGDDGDLYGTTFGGGIGNSRGTVFRIDLSGALEGLHSFDGSDGAGPRAALFQASDGDFYGTTSYEGANGFGTVFRMDSSGEVFPIHHFDDSDGAFSQSALIQADDGNLYGTTQMGGTDGYGTVFQMDTSGALTTLHDFDYFEGINPWAGLVEGVDGALYGTTANGGNSGGTVFRIDTLGNFSVIHHFNYLDGVAPLAGLVVGTDGNLYGTAAAGGPAGAGVVFRITSSALSINAITPTSGPASGGTPLNLLGGGYLTGAAITVGGAPGTSVTVLDPTFLYGATPVLLPGTLNDVSVANSGPAVGAPNATLSDAYFADFLDVPQGDIFHDYVETVFRNGITAGCGGGNYCRNSAVTRAQMAVFLLKASHGASYLPPPCAGIFGDVVCPSPFADWIEQLAAEGITGGCGGGNFCPGAPVTRAQMAVFLLKTEHGSSYAPPGCTGVFGDVTCPSLFADWIEQLAAEGITGGCGGGNYCPGASSTRGQMAVFLVKTFDLP